MEPLKSISIQCPYCGEVIELIVDGSVDEQEYVEDCEVCCRPIMITIASAFSETPQITLRQEGE